MVVHRVHSIVFAEVSESRVLDVLPSWPVSLRALLLQHHLLSAGEAECRQCHALRDSSLARIERAEALGRVLDRLELGPLLNAQYQCLPLV